MSSVPAPHQEIGSSLLALLRRELDEPGLEYAEPPALLASGVTADTYAFRLRGARGAAEGPLVCRVIRPESGEPADEAMLEHALQNALSDLGFPTPRVLCSGGPESSLAAAFLVMPCVPGRNAFGLLLAALAFGVLGLALGFALVLVLVLLAYWAWMARMLTRLHALPCNEVLARLEAAGIPADRLRLVALLDRLETPIERHSLRGFSSGIRWLREHRPDPSDRPVVGHGDFWVGNLMLSTRGTWLLDWTQACLGHPEFDLGWMSIQHLSRIPLSNPPSERIYDIISGALRPFAWLLLGANRVVYGFVRSVDPVRLRYFTALAAFRVLVKTAELRDRSQGQGRPADMLVAWGSPATSERLRSRFHRITGIDLIDEGRGGA